MGKFNFSIEKLIGVVCAIAGIAVLFGVLKLMCSAYFFYLLDGLFPSTRHPLGHPLFWLTIYIFGGITAGFIFLNLFFNLVVVDNKAFECLRPNIRNASVLIGLMILFSTVYTIYNVSKSISIKHIKNNDVEMVERSLLKGIDINQMIFGFDSALGFTARANAVDVCKLLIKNGADVNQRNKRGWTALMLAVRHGHFEIIRLLISKGADINAQTPIGKTALMMTRNIEVVKLLVENGADVNHKTKPGRTVFDYLCSPEDNDIISYLKEYSAK